MSAIADKLFMYFQYPFVVNALIVAVSRKKGNELEVTLSKLEEIWAKYEVYDKPGNH